MTTTATPPVLPARPPHHRASLRTYRALFDRRRSVAMFEGIARDYGDIAEFRLANHTIWLISEPGLTREVLVDNGRSVTKGEGLRLMRLVLGNGILTNTDAVSHRRNRRLIQPAFSASRLAAYAEVMVAAAGRADARWQAGEVVDMPGEMAQITLDVVGRTLLGDDTDRDAKAITDAVAVVLRRFGLGFVPGATKLLKLRVPPMRQMQLAIAAMRGTVEGIVGRHLRGQSTNDDIVAALIAARDEGASLSEEQVQDETLTLLLAGFETTANALGWAWWLLDGNPVAADRLRAELQEVLGDGPATYDDMQRLPYTTAVIAETMRLRPPAWILEREVTEPIMLGGYQVPVGMTLLTSPWILHHDPRSWGPDAREFRPDRWLTADGGFDPTAPGQPRGAYLPFGAGSRICIGESFAWAEATLVLATLARRWAPATEPGQEIGMWAAVTLRPHPGIRMRLEQV